MISSRVIGSDGKVLKINGEGEISVTVHNHPPISETVEAQPFRQFFEVDSLIGLSVSDKWDMREDGSTTPVEYHIRAVNNYDLFIKTLSIKLADQSAVLNKFGNLTALTNGLEFEWSSQALGTVTIHDGIKDNLEFFRLAGIHTPAIVDLSGSGADAIIVSVDLAYLFGTPWGIRLVKGTKERLTFRVNDNITSAAGVDEFNIIAYGTKL